MPAPLTCADPTPATPPTGADPLSAALRPPTRATPRPPTGRRRALAHVALLACALTFLTPGCSDDGGGETDPDTSDGDTTDGDTTDGDTTDGDTTDPDTSDPGACGDGDLDPGEACDDGGRVDGDGCSAACALELDAATVVINEVVAAPLAGEEDWIELLNLTAAHVALEGWRLRDSNLDNTFFFSPGAALAPGERRVLERDAAGSFGFGLGGADEVRLSDAAGRLIDGAQWLDGDAPQGASWGRLPDGEGAFETLYAPSRGAVNAQSDPVTCGDGVVSGNEVCDGAAFGALTCASLGFAGGALTCVDCFEVDAPLCEVHAGGALVINEVSSTADYIELHNPGAAPVDLGGWAIGDSDLERDGHLAALPDGLSVPAGGYLVLTSGVDFDFGLGGDDAALLLDADGRVIDRADWDEGQAAVAYCRTPDGTGAFAICPDPSPGAVN